MAKPLHIIYVPGLGDAPASASFRFQQRAVAAWRLLGVSAEVVPMNWSDDEPWQSKLARLEQAIDIAYGNGRAVGLVGSSAGAAAVIAAFAHRTDETVGVVTIAGKINRPERIGTRYSAKNPALLPAVEASQLATEQLRPDDRRRILSNYALYDGVVTRADSRVSGARNRSLPSVGHAFTIGTRLMLGGPGIVRFLRRQIDK